VGELFGARFGWLPRYQLADVGWPQRETCAGGTRQSLPQVRIQTLTAHLLDKESAHGSNQSLVPGDTHRL
jgi:hypothetical protein